MTDFTTRFAPSPTGYLHLGHAFSALLAHDEARAAGGRLVLRIEDIDTTRCKPAFEAAIMEDLRWCGVIWAPPVIRQSDRLAIYDAALATLRDRNVVYRCFKTRKEVARDTANAPHLGANGPEGPQYIGAPLDAREEAQLLEKGAAYAWRLSMARAREALGGNFAALSFLEYGQGSQREKKLIQATPEIFGDAVIARKDLGTSYHLSSVIDDAAQGISHVIRGEDLFAATHLHRLLQALLDLPTPIYRHHRLITDEHGKRYAKRDQSITLRALRDAGETPMGVRRRVGLA